MRIDNTTRALVTGASKGIGRAMVSELASRGARVGLLARSKDALEEVAAELPNDPIVLAADVTDRGEVERSVEELVEVAGGLDLVVANAGVAHYGPFVEAEAADLEQMVSVNVLGCIYTVRAALGPMLASGRIGHVVIVSSGAGLRAFPDAAVYGATKAANRALAEALRHELAGTPVGLTTVYPGEVATDLHTHEWEKMPDWREGEDELDPAVLARQVAEAIESGDRAVYAPKLVRLLGFNGIAPSAVDVLLRRIRGESAAPRR